MDKIKLFDTSTFDIEDGASLDHIIINAKTAAKANAAAAKFTSQNLVHVEFLHGDETTGIYENLALTEVSEDAETQNPSVNGKKVTVSLYQM